MGLLGRSGEDQQLIDKLTRNGQNLEAQLSKNQAELKKIRDEKTKLEMRIAETAETRSRAAECEIELKNLKAENLHLRQLPGGHLHTVGGELLIYTGNAYLRAAMIRGFAVRGGLLTHIDDEPLVDPYPWNKFEAELNQYSENLKED